MPRQRKPSKSRAKELARLQRLGTDDHYVDAALYDFEYEEQEADIEWYEAIAEERAGDRPIVEMGIGTGRIAIPLARAGHRVIGIDRKIEMLEHLEAKLAEEDEEVVERFELVEGDITDLPLRSAIGLASSAGPRLRLLRLSQFDHLRIVDRRRFARRVGRDTGPGESD